MPVDTVGTHCILELGDCPAELLLDRSFVVRTLKEAAEAAGLTLLGELSHQFAPHGVTAIALLSESHLSVHTWPEKGYVAVDLFTCGASAIAEKACRHLVRAFRAGNHHLRTLPRGHPSHLRSIASDAGGEDA